MTLPRKKVGLKLCLFVAICLKKNLVKFFCRVNPGGEVDDPPPQKIVGLNLNWVVVSCPKIFFVQKKLGRVNPGGGVDDPPSENSRVKIVLGCCKLSENIFCQEKNGVGLTLGGGEVDDLPPRK